MMINKIVGDDIDAYIYKTEYIRNEHEINDIYIYVIKCEKEKYYMGSSDIVRRIKEHKDGE